MVTKTAKQLAAEALAKREAWPGYFPTLAELKAIDTLLVAQARQRQAKQKKTAA